MLDVLKIAPSEKSAKKLPINVIAGLEYKGEGKQLVRLNYRNQAVLKPGIARRKVTAARRKVYTFKNANDHMLKKLNESLSGGEGYPVLSSILGVAAGAVSGGAGFLWTAFTTTMAVVSTAQPVLAREGDEVWLFELLCKQEGGFFSNTKWEMIHISYYVLIDPYRKKQGGKGFMWYIHEGRRDVVNA